MQKAAIIGISAGATTTAVVLVVLFLVLPNGLLGGSNLVPIDTSFTRPISAGNWDHIGATMESGERWVVDYTSTASVNAYLLDWGQFEYFYTYGSFGGYLSYKSGTSGHFDYSASSAGNYIVVFRASSSTTVSGTTTEYHFP